MKNVQQKNIEINQKLIAVLDELLAAGKWDASLFLKVAGKRFQELRNQAEQLLIEATGSGAAAAKNIGLQEKPGHIKIYISVYQTEGNDLHKWHRTLLSLTEYSITRPAYQNEEHVKAMVRAKENVQREGYVIVWVKEDDIIQLPASRTAMDRFGNELVTLKAGAVKPENIIKFVHCGNQYRFCEKELAMCNEVK